MRSSCRHSNCTHVSICDKCPGEEVGHFDAIICLHVDDEAERLLASLITLMTVHVFSIVTRINQQCLLHKILTCNADAAKTEGYVVAAIATCAHTMAVNALAFTTRSKPRRAGSHPIPALVHQVPRSISIKLHSR